MIERNSVTSTQRYTWRVRTRAGDFWMHVSCNLTACWHDHFRHRKDGSRFGRNVNFECCLQQTVSIFGLWQIHPGDLTERKAAEDDLRWRSSGQVLVQAIARYFRLRYSKVTAGDFLYRGRCQDGVDMAYISHSRILHEASSHTSNLTSKFCGWG